VSDRKKSFRFFEEKSESKCRLSSGREVSQPINRSEKGVGGVDNR
jgi:hypothetical protein